MTPHHARKGRGGRAGDATIRLPDDTVPRSPMRNPLQDQLLKAGLVKKGKVDQVAREQSKQRQGKAPAGPTFCSKG